MRIVIDLQSCQTESRFRGIGRYSLALTQAICRQNEDHEIWLALSDRFPESVEGIRNLFADLLPPEQIVVFSVPERVAEYWVENSWLVRAAEQVREAFLASLKPDVVLVTSLFEGYVDDALSSVPASDAPFSVYTALILYDLIPLMNPKKYFVEKKYRTHYHRKLEHLKQADHFFSISRYSREEGIRLLDLPPENITNIATAVDENFQNRQLSASEKINLCKRLGIHEKFLLYAPGGFDPRKNIEGLLRAFAHLPRELQKQYQLVIASRIDEWSRSEYLRTAGRLKIPKRVLRFTGYISNDDLIALYSSCHLFVFPSLAEGFGLPALEAMSCGAPVIGSSTTSIPEVIGLEEAMFDPNDSEAIGELVRKSLEDATFYQKLLANSQKRASLFSWDNAAQLLLQTLAKEVPIKNKEVSGEIKAETLIQHIGRLTDEKPGKNSLIKIANSIAKNELILRRSVLSNISKDDIIQIEGPFDSSYSLALVNRELALALDALGYLVTLHSTEGPGDFEPDREFLKLNPRVNKLHELSRSNKTNFPSIVSRDLFPPRVNDMRGALKSLHLYGWEESGFPAAWIGAFNEYLDGITTLSRHVKNVLINNGVSVPLLVGGCGVDHWERIEADPAYQVAGKSFKFLHISSCFSRKGAEILLRAFGRAFRKHDDVSLIIKTFPNPHNRVEEQLAELQRADRHFPDVQIIMDDLSGSELKQLYFQCDAFVMPTKAEGFGLPIAEAALCNLPVIVTGWSGQMDFCNPDDYWLIDYHFEYAETHFELFDSVWAVPEEEHLAELMQEVRHTDRDEVLHRCERIREFLMRHFTWEEVAKRYIRSCNNFALTASWNRRQPLKIAWISTWNTRCGIATYSDHLISNMPNPGELHILAPETEEFTDKDGNNVHRCWEEGECDDLSQIEKTVAELDSNIIVIQFDYGFFAFPMLKLFIQNQVNSGRVIIVELHATTDPIHRTDKKLHSLKDIFAQCERLIVHSVSDLNRLKEIGLVENVALFPLGTYSQNPTPKNKSLRENLASRKSSRAFLLASFGFFLPHKGLIELLKAFNFLVRDGLNLRLRMVNAEYPIDTSRQTIDRAKRYIKRHHLEEKVELITDFLPEEESLNHLAETDLLVLPHHDTTASASAAVRMALTASKRVAVTPVSIFENVREAVFELSGTSPRDLSESLKPLIQGIRKKEKWVQQKAATAERWCEEHAFRYLAPRLNGILRALLLQKNNPDIYPD